jgi:DNA polymerase I-like protein with 3'-5' exonuclease and polymerase domains
MVYFISNQQSVIKYDDTLIQSTTVEHVLDYFTKSKYDSIAVDTETEGRDSHVKKIISLQLGTPEHQFVIDVRNVNIKLFKDLLETNLLLMHNAKFDYKFLKAAGIVCEHIYDTMVTEAVLYCGYFKYGYGLKDLVLRYCNVTMNKDTRGEFFHLGDKPMSSTQILYAAFDTKYLHDIRIKQQERADKVDLNYVINLENQVVKSLADIEYNGIYLNKEKWLENTKQFEFDFIELELKLDNIVLNDPILKKKIQKNNQLDLFAENTRLTNINYGSPLQITRILHLLGFDVTDSNDRTLQKIAKKHEFCEVLQDYRGIKTIVERYGREFTGYINKHTNRVHTDFWQVLSTGRISSGNDDMNAPNIQNIPRDNLFRNCFEARPGFKWISIDYSSQELRLMADGSGEEGFINVLNRGEDLHCYAGSMMFKRTITKADSELRNKAKTINFGKPLTLAA